MRLSIDEQIKLFKKAVDPYKQNCPLFKTQDGFISNRHWAISEGLLELLPYKEYLFSETQDVNFLDMIRKELEETVKVYENFDYYAVRTESIETLKKGQIYILDIPELFKKVGILKVYADFIEGVVWNCVRKLYITEHVNKLNKKETRAYFVWSDPKDETLIEAVCCGIIHE